MYTREDLWFVDASPYPYEIRQWELELHRRSKCSVRGQVGISPFVFVAGISVFTDRVLIGPLASDFGERSGDRQRGVELAGLVDPVSAGLAHHDRLSGEGESGCLLPRQIATAGVSDQLPEVLEHCLSDGELPQMIHRDSLPGRGLVDE